MDGHWTWSSIWSSVPSGKKTKHSSSTRRITSRRRWCDRILETKRWSSEQIWALSTLVWRNVEEQNGRRRRQQEKIPVLYWFFRNNLVSPSSSWSFRTQSHWSYTSGQCVDSQQFLRVHSSHRMCNQFTLHHMFRIDSVRTKFKQGKTDGILYSRESHEYGSQESAGASFDQTTPCIVRAKAEKTPGYSVFGRHTACSTKRIEVLSNKIERNHLLRYTPSLLYLESSCDEFWRNHIPESTSVTSTTTEDFLQRQLDEWIGFRSRWKQQRYPTNSTQTKNPIIKNGETRRWARVHKGNRERYFVWHENVKHSTRTGDP